MTHQSQDTIHARSNAREHEFAASLEGLEALMDRRVIERHIAAGRRLRAQAFANFLRSLFSWSARKGKATSEPSGGQALRA